LHSERWFGAIPGMLIWTERPHINTIGKSGDESHLVADEARLSFF